VNADIDDDVVDAYIAGMSCVLLGLCVLYSDRSADDMYNPCAIADVINLPIGFSSFFNLLSDAVHNPLLLSATSATSFPVPLIRQTAKSLLEKDDKDKTRHTHAGVDGDQNRGYKGRQKRRKKERKERGT
jgi:hypothetical protein